MKLTIIASLLFVNSLTLAQTSLHPIEKDPNTVDGRPLQTDKVLLRDGSEKKHITKKVKSKPSPNPTAEKPAGLPTDVD